MVNLAVVGFGRWWRGLCLIQTCWGPRASKVGGGTARMVYGLRLAACLSHTGFWGLLGRDWISHLQFPAEVGKLG